MQSLFPPPSIVCLQRPANQSNTDLPPLLFSFDFPLSPSSCSSSSHCPPNLFSSPLADSFSHLPGYFHSGYVLVGDTMTVLDIGYSKVDLTSHTILGLRPSRRMQQLSRVDHEFGYAGYHADENFKQFLRGKLKDEEGFSERTLGPAVVAFEATAKRTFSVASVESVPEEAFRIPVGGMADNVELRIQDG
ncbi:hypothetical protein PG989_000777 [Apiospora arundinis]